MMIVDSHVHGMHAERNSEDKYIPPLLPAPQEPGISPAEFVRNSLRSGIEKVVVLDPTEITFHLLKTYGDYVIPVPQVDMDNVTPAEIDALFQRGAVGIKFIAPEKSYASEFYMPLYETIRNRNGLAVFHTGFLILDTYEPGGLHARNSFTDITHMRPAALDKIARVFPDLKILMAHFGNPWWEEAFCVIANHPNIYADLSGGTAYRRSMNMWTEIFAPNGKLDTDALGKLCFGSDESYFFDNGSNQDVKKFIDFHRLLLERLKAPEELCRKIFRENILKLTGLTA